eukprot:TRINITY_DN6876_c0_g2_i17.p1 TRINITY_DN6876_c0_g2~~TRINITY_DN6876_c0_g2_i17.p1  ORF type:complete len:149 (+),score=3.41 TRINITY_DN6876_c0_g2_i17:73-519(+)
MCIRDRYMGNIYNNLGAVYSYKCDYENTMKNFKCALKIHFTNNGKEDMNATQLYYNIGATYLIFGKNHEAEAYISKAISICTKLKQVDCILLARYHYYLGKALANLRRYNKAIKSLETALKMYLSKPQGNEEAIAELRKSLNELYTLV